VTHVGPLDGSARPGTIGLPLPDTDARIVDPVMGQFDVPPGTIGELIVKGPQVMLGYLNDPEATARTIRDGWLYTGDLAVQDADGFFRIVDRKKDLIITSGFNVYPSDVEQVLRSCPGVADVAIIGVPDVKRGEVVKAVVVPHSRGRFHRSAFDAFCEEHLAKHKRPRVVEIIEADLPRNFLGKVFRRKLREAHIESAMPAGPAELTQLPGAPEPTAACENELVRFELAVAPAVGPALAPSQLLTQLRETEARAHEGG
jgi:long-chain acyl-CoA synthetase